MSIKVQIKDLPVHVAEGATSRGRTRVRAREIISARATAEFDARLKTAYPCRRSLLNFKTPRFANQNFAKQSALEAFKQGAFSLRIDGKPCLDLDQEFSLGPNAQILFVVPQPIFAG